MRRRLPRLPLCSGDIAGDDEGESVDDDDDDDDELRDDGDECCVCGEALKVGEALGTFVGVGEKCCVVLPALAAEGVVVEDEW
jgi:hypothetical protein